MAHTTRGVHEAAIYVSEGGLNRKGVPPVLPGNIYSAQRSIGERRIDGARKFVRGAGEVRR